MTDIAIKVDSLSKMYRIGAGEKRPDGFWAAARQAALSPFDHLRRSTRPPNIGRAESCREHHRTIRVQVGHGYCSLELELHQGTDLREAKV